MTPARHWMRCGKFIEDNATACDSSPLNQYQRRFSQDVAPQYVDISAGGGK